MDAYGREADDFAMHAPENRQYLDYYREMGMTIEQARAFYDFTNSVPHARALWLDAGTGGADADPYARLRQRHFFLTRERVSLRRAAL